jgi:hypothetical protein
MKMIKARLYTEHKNREAIERSFAQHFSNFTIFEAAGYWKGTRENSVCIEVIALYERCIMQDIFTLIAEKINRGNDQECCMFTLEEIETFAVYSR